jgi:FkbM family methyltransferase
MNWNTYKDTFRRWSRYMRRLGPRITLQYAAQRSSRDIMEFKVPGISAPIYCRSNGPDFFVLYDLIGKKRGDFPIRTPPKLIVDAGAHAGFASVFYANRWPDAKIIALEPESHNFQLLRANCASYPNVTTIQGTLWHQRTQLRIINPDAKSWAFRVRESDPQTAERLPVEAYTVSDLLELSGQPRISLLKIDIEGSEFDVFSHDTDPWLEKIDAILIELHERFRPGSRQVFEQAVARRQVGHFKNGESDGVLLVA